MRARNIKPGFFKNDVLGEVEPLARVLFIGLWCLADRAGRLADRPRKIKAEILPYDDCDVERLLDVLDRQGFIVRYQAAGERYLWIPGFLRHQNPHPRETASGIPAPPEDPPRSAPGLALAVTDPVNSQTGPADSLDPDPGILNPDYPEPPAGSESATAQAGTGVVAVDAATVKQLETVLLEVSGKKRPTARDRAAIRAGLALAGGDGVWLQALVRQAARQFRPEYPGDRIGSFAYFLPVIEHALQQRGRAEPPGAAVTGNAAPADPAADAALTAELLRLLEREPLEGGGGHG